MMRFNISEIVYRYKNRLNKILKQPLSWATLLLCYFHTCLMHLGDKKVHHVKCLYAHVKEREKYLHCFAAKTLNGAFTDLLSLD